MLFVTIMLWLILLGMLYWYVEETGRLKSSASGETQWSVASGQLKAKAFTGNWSLATAHCLYQWPVKAKMNLGAFVLATLFVWLILGLTFWCAGCAETDRRVVVNYAGLDFLHEAAYGDYELARIEAAHAERRLRIYKPREVVAAPLNQKMVIGLTVIFHLEQGQVSVVFVCPPWPPSLGFFQSPPDDIHCSIGIEIRNSEVLGYVGKDECGLVIAQLRFVRSPIVKNNQCPIRRACRSMAV